MLPYFPKYEKNNWHGQVYPEIQWMYRWNRNTEIENASLFSTPSSNTLCSETRDETGQLIEEKHATCRFPQMTTTQFGVMASGIFNYSFVFVFLFAEICFRVIPGNVLKKYWWDHRLIDFDSTFITLISVQKKCVFLQPRPGTPLSTCLHDNGT